VLARLTALLGISEEIMPRFSERYGYTSAEKLFQRETVDLALRTKLWNSLKITIWDRYNHNSYNTKHHSEKVDLLVKRAWIHYFNKDLDEYPEFYSRYGKGLYDILKEHFYTCAWYEVYNFIEIISNDESNLLESKDDSTRKWINQILEEYNSAYRFVGKDIAEITDKNEIEAIDCAINDSSKPVKAHLELSLKMLSDRESPDYRNSIKESISAVEAQCRLLTDNQSATLGDALKKVGNLHPAMQKAFAQLYGYTSDASGIRHSLVEESNITYADAKFMLVACSAFISYLKVSADHA
jgi:hypothetical protein